MFRAIALSVAVIALTLGVHATAGANARHVPVNPLAGPDYGEINRGAAVRYHKDGRTWLHIAAGGLAYMKVDADVWRFVRIVPKGNLWACMPMTFQRASRGGGQVQVLREGRTWTLRFTFGTQVTTIRGLVCSYGK